MSFNFSDEYEKLLPKFWKKEKESMDPKDLGIQNVFTPIEKIEETTQIKFSDFVTSEMKDIAILFNVEFLQSLLKNINENYINNINFTFFYDSKWDLKQANEIARMYDKEVNFISIEKFSESKNVKDLVEAMGTKHFDIVFSNPPYNRNIDLKILESLFDKSTNIIFVHPAGFLIDKKFMTNLYNDIRNTNHLEKVLMFWGNELFQIALFMPICISVWNTNKNNLECKVIDKAFSNETYICKINDISFHGKYLNKINNFRNVILNKINENGSLYTHKVKEDYSDLSEYGVKIALLRGHPGENNKSFNEDFFTLMCKNNIDNFINSTFRYKENYAYTYWNIWSFKNKEEQLNFVNYCKTKIVRFIMTFIKVGQNLATGEMRFIPWLDFTQEWNDKKLCEEFNISKELWEYIDNFIPNYYDDYVSGF